MKRPSIASVRAAHARFVADHGRYPKQRELCAVLDCGRHYVRSFMWQAQLLQSDGRVPTPLNWSGRSPESSRREAARRRSEYARKRAAGVCVDHGCDKQIGRAHV